MISPVTFAAVDDICLDADPSERVEIDSAPSDTADAPSALSVVVEADELDVFPNPSFHFDAFFVTIGCTTSGSLGAGASDTGDLTDERLGELSDAVAAPLDARLSSRARLCEAEARMSAVKSRSDVDVWTTPPLPLRAPRFRRLVVEVARDSERSSGSSASWHIESSVASISNAGPREGARERPRDRGTLAPWNEACLEDGRREGGTEERGCPVMMDVVDDTRLCVGLEGEDCPSKAGRSLAQRPNSRAETRCESSVES